VVGGEDEVVAWQWREVSGESDPLVVFEDCWKASAICFLPCALEGRTEFAALCADGTLQFYHLGSEKHGLKAVKLTQQIKGKKGGISMTVSPCGRFIATGFVLSNLIFIPHFEVLTLCTMSILVTATRRWSFTAETQSDSFLRRSLDSA
jgi:hypothetical protein